MMYKFKGIKLNSYLAAICITSFSSGAFSKNIDTELMPYLQIKAAAGPKAGPKAGKTHYYDMGKSIIINVDNWDLINFKVPDSRNEKMNCDQLQNSDSPITKSQCKSSSKPLTCEDYNKAATQNLGYDAYLWSPLRDIKQWWNHRKSYSSNVDVIINGGWFDITEIDNVREGPVMYKEACSGTFGLLASNSNNMSVSNSAISSDNVNMGKLDSLVIKPLD